MRWGLPGLVIALVADVGLADEAGPRDRTPAERGRVALWERTFTPPAWSVHAYETVWKQWGVSAKPADYARAVQERYGLHPAPYDNEGLPMGLRYAPGIFGKGIAVNCLLCHAGSIAGQSVIGLGNASLDMQSLYDDLAAASGLYRGTPFPFSNVRGTTEAGAMAVYLFQFRNPDLSIRPRVDLGVRTDLCEDVPAWWLLKKKKTMYYTGSSDARSVRALMQFMLTPLNSGEYIRSQEETFRDIQAYLLTLEPPKYPFPIDEALAARGQVLFTKHCASCHGTYGEEETYPNKIIELEKIGTDRTRAEGFTTKAKEAYDTSWFGQELGPDGRPYRTNDWVGYQAPPLDGVWATAPYFHNGSVPTLEHVLNSKSRPAIYTRSFRTGVEDYDPVKVGWKITVLDRPADPKLPAHERRKIYDTTQPGRGNAGHPFGDKLTNEERRAVIEYLKTL